MSESVNHEVGLIYHTLIRVAISPVEPLLREGNELSSTLRIGMGEENLNFTLLAVVDDANCMNNSFLQCSRQPTNH